MYPQSVLSKKNFIFLWGGGGGGGGGGGSGDNVHRGDLSCRLSHLYTITVQPHYNTPLYSAVFNIT